MTTIKSPLVSLSHHIALLFLIVVAFFSSSPYFPAAYAACQNYGDGSSNCPADLPCCYQGQCGTGAKGFCIAGGCEPENSFSSLSCYAPPPCKSARVSFSEDRAAVPRSSYFGDPRLADYIYEDSASVHLNDGLLQLTLASPGSKPEAVSTRWLQYGSVTARIRSASSSPGVVSQFLISDEDGNEIDFNWVGSDPRHVQANYNYDNQLTSLKATLSPDLGNTAGMFHDYTILWSPQYVTWAVDGISFRTINYNDTRSVGDNDYKFPTKPSQIFFKVWDGGSSSNSDTRQWAGGSPANFSARANYTMSVQWVQVSCNPQTNNDSSTFVLPSEVVAYESQLSLSFDGDSLINHSKSSDRDNNGDDSDIDQSASIEVISKGSPTLVASVGAIWWYSVLASFASAIYLVTLA
ncbi:putative glycosidase CRH2 [Spiromyces aspiralis]|uniref:Glycosidase CRH2 n=1 Tax=Spiromyces aspiralis TaxID=68401 RepID=A0ACC1HSW9_9FUNG|nr:putative glycosidase CRH2 [Spiromyces aspiralis]